VVNGEVTIEAVHAVQVISWLRGYAGVSCSP
jgi:hypothetical protein